MKITILFYFTCTKNYFFVYYHFLSLHGHCSSSLYCRYLYFSFFPSFGMYCFVSILIFLDFSFLQFFFLLLLFYILHSSPSDKANKPFFHFSFFLPTSTYLRLAIIFSQILITSVFYDLHHSFFFTICCAIFLIHVLIFSLSRFILFLRFFLRCKFSSSTS
jgi:hypothetical protein